MYWLCKCKRHGITKQRCWCHQREQCFNNCTVRIVSPNATTLFSSNSNSTSHEGMLLTLCDNEMFLSSEKRKFTWQASLVLQSQYHYNMYRIHPPPQLSIPCLKCMGILFHKPHTKKNSTWVTTVLCHTQNVNFKHQRCFLQN